MVLSPFERTMLSLTAGDSDKHSMSVDVNLNLVIPQTQPEKSHHSVFMDAFIQNNRLEQVSQVMGYHPDYLRNFLTTQNFLLREDGPLPYEYRHYIAVMAAARHHCAYLVKLHEQDFLLHNGNPDWLQGIHHAPKKLQDLYEINKILAHRPWMITKDHIKKLLKPEKNSDKNSQWSLSELMQAIILLSHFHSLCSFVYGCGISAELDISLSQTQTQTPHANGGSPHLPHPHHSIPPHCIPQHHMPLTPPILTSDPSSVAPHHPPYECCQQNGVSLPHIPLTPITPTEPPKHPPFNCAGQQQMNGVSKDSAKQTPRDNGNISALMEKMRQLTEEPAGDASPEELLKRFHFVEHQSAEITVPSSKNSSPKSEILRHVIDSEFSYTDWANRESTSEVPTFRACDYSWEDHGFSLANRLYLDVGNLLDAKYTMAANLTYHTMGDNREVDTSSFRQAIWNYIHSLYGIRHDDYDYSVVNQLLERNLKAYIKTLTCYPERLTREEYDGVMREFKHSEKVHVNLMLMEARQQAELLYALRALTRYMT